jgi:hypothetical protein
MRKINLIILVVTAIASSSLAAPATDDLWDVSVGTTVIANGPMLYGSSVRNMFGATEGQIEAAYGNALFEDGDPEGTIHWVQWQTTVPVVLGSFKLYAIQDGPEYGGGRAFDHFSLLAKNPSGNWEEIFSADNTVPYNYLDGYGLVIEYTFSSGITAQEFEARFRQYGYIEGASGPRVVELDGFAVPEPATICLLGLGALGLLKKRKA